VIYPYGNLRFPAPFSDTATDDISNSDGRVDQFALIDFKLSDKKLIDNINERISESKAYYDDATGFNLGDKRAENLRMYLGLQVNQSDFYDQEEPYVENQIRGAVESIVAYCSARSPQSTVIPANDTPEAKKFASNLERAHEAHATEHDLRGLVEVAVRSWLLNQAAYLLLEYDPSYGDDGDIVPSIIPCDELVVDKNAKYGQDPDFITIFEKQTVEDLIFNYPEKKQDILDHFGIKKRGKSNMTQEVVTKKTWFTYFVKGERKQGMCVYFEDLMLIKTGDLNWLHGKKNFLRAPMKPIIPLNVLNDGKHWVDFSNPLEDAIKMQRLLNVRGRQISLNADGSNGTKIVNAKASGLTKEDAENWVPGPNKTIFLKRAKDGVPLNQMVDIIQGQDLKPFVAQDKNDMRVQLGYLMGVPIDQTDATAGDQDPTLGQALIKKNNMNARQDMIVRALDRFLYRYFNLLTQMMFVWYDDEHYFSYLDEDGSFERIVIKRYYFDDGMRVGVRGGSTIAFDKNREQAIATHLMDKGAISNLDGYRLLGLPNPQKLYDNWVKQTKSPQDLMRDGNEAVDNAEAYAEFLDIMNGADPEPKEDPSKEFILTLRKLMISDKFLTAKSKYRNAFTKRLNKYLDSYEQRMALDQLGQEDIAKIEPGKPVPTAPTPPPMPGAPGAMPGMPPQMGAPMGAPMGQPMPGPGMPPGVPGMPPMMGAGMPPMPMPGGQPNGPGMFSGGPVPNPANPQTPSGLGAIPGF
jgi:hypothetical protein